MKIRVAERHMVVSDALRRYALQKAEALSRYFDRIISIDVVLEVEKGNQIAEMVAHLIKRKFVKARAESTDLYASIDAAVDKLKQQLRRHKDQLKQKRPARDASPRRGPEAVADGGSRPLIQRTQIYLRKPMSLDEAVLQLESHPRDFLIFMDSDSQQLNILHRRVDGQLELLEPRY